MDICEKVSIRKFSKQDISNKINWINNSDNNKYLHYELPLQFDKTVEWYDRIKNLDTRYDAVIEFDKVPVGLIGLLNIDKKNKKAEYYICMGDGNFKGKGIATIASEQLLNYAFNTLNLNKVYLYTEKDNIAAQRLFEKLGFIKEGELKQDLIYMGRKVDRYIYGVFCNGWVYHANSQDQSK